jgi:hypothetical protein
MAEYSVTTPDGASYTITADSDAQAQSAINSLLEGSGPSSSPLEAAGRGALNNFPLAKQATAALESGNYSENLQDLSQKAQVAKSAHPIAYGAGAVAGAVAPALIPGVGPALRASPMLGNALLGAAQGISDTDLVKHPEEALKQGATGAVVGGVLGKLMPSGEKAAEGLEDYANTKTVQSLGMKPQSLGVPGEDIQNMGNMAHELGLDAGGIEDKFNTAKDALLQTGKAD